MEKPYIVEALLKKVEDEVEAEDVEKKVEGPSDVGTFVVPEEVVAQTLETIEEEEQPASDVVEFVSTCNDLNSISDNILNSSNSPPMTKPSTLTPPQSPKPNKKTQYHQNMTRTYLWVLSLSLPRKRNQMERLKRMLFKRKSTQSHHRILFIPHKRGNGE